MKESARIKKMIALQKEVIDNRKLMLANQEEQVQVSKDILMNAESVLATLMQQLDAAEGITN